MKLENLEKLRDLLAEYRQESVDQGLGYFVRQKLSPVVNCVESDIKSVRRANIIEIQPTREPRSRPCGSRATNLRMFK